MGSSMSNNTSRTRNIRLFFCNSLRDMLEIIGNDNFLSCITKCPLFDCFLGRKCIMVVLELSND